MSPTHQNTALLFLPRLSLAIVADFVLNAFTPNGFPQEESETERKPTERKTNKSNTPSFIA